ncbi:MAG: MotA/TolQ/ExbB proton channel family protein [bacterium]
MMHLGFVEFVKTSPMVIGVLIFFSVMMVAYAIERWWVFKSKARFDEQFWQRITNFVLQDRLKDAISLCEVTKNVYAEIFRAGIDASQFSRQDAEDSMVIQKEECQEELRKRLGLFGTFSFISPLLGLLGTVLGIMRAFHDMSIAGSGGPSIVAAGISQALITTVVGIVVAIPSAIFYNYFTFKLRAVIVHMNAYSQRLLVLLFEKRYKQKK